MARTSVQNLIVVGAVLVCTLLCSVHALELDVEIESGIVRGFPNKLKPNVGTWWGIPFAAPPVGALRWKPPVPAEKWAGVKECTAKPPVCPMDKVNSTSFKGTEDCLTLNVYVPLNATKTSKLPVMFFIHGGGFRMGDSLGNPGVDGVSNSMFDGSNLADKHDVVVVSINYRLGIFGFLGHAELMAENPHNSTGNYGIMDQRLALQWVQANIEAFGGDPQHVLMFGESAGGISSCIHFVSPASAGLFTAVLAESPLCAGKLPFTALDISLNLGKLLVEKIGCNKTTSEETWACMRAKPTGDVLQGEIGPKVLPSVPVHLPWGSPVMPWMPTVDGSTVGVLAQPIDLIHQGKFNDVPVAMGTNRDEGVAFLVAVSEMSDQALPWNKTKMHTALGMFWESETIRASITDRYNDVTYKDWDSAATAVMRDYFLACPSRAFLRAVQTSRLKTNSPLVNQTYGYFFAREYDSILWPIMGDVHGVELWWVFDHHMTLAIWTNVDKQLAREIGSYWSAMARTGNPNDVVNCDTCVQWPSYTSVTNQTTTVGDEYLVLKDQLTTLNGLYKDDCDFWDNLGYNT